MDFTPEARVGSYRQELQIPTRLRRKFVRFSIGRARRRRIISWMAKSFSSRRAANFAFLVIRGFFKRSLQYGKHGDILRSSRRLLTLDDISEGSHLQCGIADPFPGTAFA